jgi:glutamate-5-semialdehyde dehydrogenase
MSVSTSAELQTSLESYCLDVARRAKQASVELAQLSGAIKNAWLRDSAKLLRERFDSLLAANELDLAAAESLGLTSAEIDRLRLTDARLGAIADALLDIANLPDPVGEIIEGSVRPNGLRIAKVRAPLGVVFFIYESRPNVTADAAAICVKSGNAVILRGGKEAAHSSRAIVELLGESAAAVGLPAHAVQLVETADRAAVGHFLRLSELIDVAIPRGGESLIRRVAEEARMPVIKHFAGNCHVYVDAGADAEMAEKIVINSKCQRYGVCNACESLLIHADCAAQVWPRLARALLARGVELRGDDRSRRLAPSPERVVEAAESDYYAEYLAPVLSVKIVDSLDEAIEHINRYGSHHTDAIVTSSLEAADRFTAGVDSAAVMVNASTRFNDGGEFGLGAEIGISTDKFHARGPCGLKELTTYKYIVHGSGQTK